jgi:ATP phosphoribosyltransferase regulatory subunit
MMSSAWVLPDHLADVLPSEARQIEELRRLFLDCARSYGYELVIPPLLEHLESLLSGTGSRLDLQTFKLVDQLSGRTLGVRPDTTPQVARIDAHLLNRAGVCRLCYCGPVLHTLPDRPFATREPLQLGAELFGHAGLEADLEVLELALSGLKAVQCSDLQVDFGDARVLRGLLTDLHLSEEQTSSLRQAVANKDAQKVLALARALSLPDATREALNVLVHLYGDASVVQEAIQAFAAWPHVVSALHELLWLSTHMSVRVSFDLADSKGYAYYSGARFAIYVQGGSDALVRGGRYDEVGAVFGRARAAVGFSLDLKALVEVLPKQAPKAAIKAPWSEDAQLREAISQLRLSGESVICALPSQVQLPDEFECDRELVLLKGVWSVVSLKV